MVKYRERGGFNHARALRLSKRVKSRKERPSISPLLDWSLGKPVYNRNDLPRVVQGYEFAKRPGANVPQMIKDYGLSWEMLPTESLNNQKVWETLLGSNQLPLGALIRQLPRLTNLGIIAPFGGHTKEIVI